MKIVLALALSTLAVSSFAADTGRYDDPVPVSTLTPAQVAAAQPTGAATGRYDEPIATSTVSRAQVLAELHEAQVLHVTPYNDPRSRTETAADEAAIRQAGLAAIGVHAGE